MIHVLRCGTTHVHRHLVRSSRRLQFPTSCLTPVSHIAHCRNLFCTEPDRQSDVTLPSGATVVIAGGGIIGCSVAYHLAQEGMKDIVLLEQGSLGGGTTWHSAGMLGRLRNSKGVTAMTEYSAKLYEKLENEGFSTGWKATGSLNLARTKDRMLYYKRSMNTAKRFGVEAEVLSPAEVKKMVPLMKTDDLEGAVWLPGDGVVNPPDIITAFAKKSQENGVRMIEGCEVREVETVNNRISSVDTNLGRISCKYFINCAGMWAHRLGQKTTEQKVRVPLHPCEHYYLVTKPIPGLDTNMPFITDFDGHVWMRPSNTASLLAGGFERQGKVVFLDGIPDGFENQLLPEDWDHFPIRDYDGAIFMRSVKDMILAGGYEKRGLAIPFDIPNDFQFKLLEENWDQFQGLLEQILYRMPLLGDVQVNQLVNGPESFTPDGMCVMGECPEIDNYYVAAGMNSSGIAMAGGVGKFMAQWILEGEPEMNLWSVDARRFVDMHNNKLFLKDRVTETIALTSEIQLWDTVMSGLTTGRNLRTSPIYPRMEHDATFGQSMGYERPLYFDSSLTEQDDYHDMDDKPHSWFGKPSWFDKVKVEYWSCREGVCLIDMSTYTKFEVRSAGSEVVDYLQYVCSNDINRPVGMVVHTGMQNQQGGYENDCSVVRLANNHYVVISPTAQQTRSYVWLRDHLPADGSVQLNDVTSMYTAINLIGPRAQELLSELTDVSLVKQDFFSMTCKSINLGQASGVLAMRLTHSGEDGWMLYIPSEYALHVYDSLMSAGRNYGIRNAGYYALRALRTEKFFAYWGTDLTPHNTPLECGREYRVKFELGGFIGYEALVKQKETGIKKKLVQFLVEDHNVDLDPWPWGGEPIYRNGVYAGNVTSTAYGYTLERHVCLAYVQNVNRAGQAGYVTNDFILKNAHFEIDIGGKRFPTKASIYPPKLPSAAIVVDPGKRESL